MMNLSSKEDSVSDVSRSGITMSERTSHVGRKTFVVTGLSSGLSPYTITQWTGHSSLKAMKPYMAIADKVKKESMKKFDEV